MKQILLFLTTLLFSSFSYALSCEQTYQGFAFNHVTISVIEEIVWCNYHNNEIFYSLGDGFTKGYVADQGNWHSEVPRFMECTAKNSGECTFKKL